MKIIYYVLAVVFFLNAYVSYKDDDIFLTVMAILAGIYCTVKAIKKT